MSALVVEDAGGRRLLTLTLVRALSTVSVLGPGLAAVLAVLAMAPDGSPWWPAPVLLALVVVAAGMPDSGVPALALVGVGSWWLAVVRDPPMVATVAVAACGLLFHLACARAASGPSGCVPSPAVIGRLAARAAGVLLVTAAIAALATLVEDHSGEGGDPGVTSVLLAAALLAVAALPWLASPPPPPR